MVHAVDLAPLSIELNKALSIVQVSWSDGVIDQIPQQKLRRYCACSTCRSKKHLGLELLTDNYEVVKLSLMGTTGVQISFADGHDRGVYPWAYIKAIADDRVDAYLNE